MYSILSCMKCMFQQTHIYHICFKYLNTISPYHNCPKIGTISFYYRLTGLNMSKLYKLLIRVKTVRWVTNSVDVFRLYVLWRLLNVFSVCSDLSVRLLKINNVLLRWKHHLCFTNKVVIEYVLFRLHLLSSIRLSLLFSVCWSVLYCRGSSFRSTSLWSSK